MVLIDVEVLGHFCRCLELRGLQERFAKALHGLQPIFTFLSVHDSAFVI